MIMGVHERSTPYSCTVCRNASWATPSQPIPARNSGTLGLGNSPCYSAPWGQRRRRSDLQPSQHQISSADLQSSSLAFPENSPPQACCFNLLQGRADSFITDLGIHFKCHESHAALPLPFLSPWLGSCGCLILSSCWIHLAAPVPRFRSGSISATKRPPAHSRSYAAPRSAPPHQSLITQHRGREGPCNVKRETGATGALAGSPTPKQQRTTSKSWTLYRI